MELFHRADAAASQGYDQKKKRISSLLFLLFLILSDHRELYTKK